MLCKTLWKGSVLVLYLYTSNKDKLFCQVFYNKKILEIHLLLLMAIFDISKELVALKYHYEIKTAYEKPGWNNVYFLKFHKEDLIEAVSRSNST